MQFSGRTSVRRDAFVAVAACLAIWACAQDAPVSPDVSTLPLFDNAGTPATFSDADLISFVDGSVVGTSELTRNSQAVSVKLQHNDAPAHAFTVWGAIFNNPDACAGSPCAFDDLFDPEVKASVARAGGRVLGAAGPATFTGRLREGDDSEALFGPGLLDAVAAEIHFILRSHGPPQVGEVSAQILTVRGGCEVERPGEIPTEPGECADIAFSAHKP